MAEKLRKNMRKHNMSCKPIALHMTNAQFDDMPNWEIFAICTYILQNFAGLTFTEATTYLWTSQFCFGEATSGKSRQAIYSLKKKAMKKINDCNVPVLDMIALYVKSAPFIWVD